ncbi:MAG TPA: TolC family protein [Planctomycetota bacterium]
MVLGCSSSDADRWSYERIIHEEAPQVRSRDDARVRHEALAARPELGLDDCWRLALHRSETLALDGEELARIRTRYEQVFAQILPYASFRASYTRQDEPPDPGASDAAQSFRQKERTQYNFNVRQPIFSGLREFYALRQNREFAAAGEDALRHAKLVLYADVADAFYAVLAADRELATQRDALRLAQERLDELSARNRLGISRRAEVLQQEAEVASIQAAIERLKGALAVAWDALRFLTGVAGVRPLVDAMPEPAPLPPLEEFSSRALARRRDLRALDAQVRAAEEGVGIARAGYFPGADLEANYYTHREGISADIDWDVLFTLEIPIFEGGATQARIREARSYVRSAVLEAQRRRREVEREVGRAWTSAAAFHAELGALEKAVASARENYEIVQAEYRQNITTNIEVLTSFNTLQAAVLERDRSRYRAKLARVRLEVESGAFPGGGSP